MEQKVQPTVEASFEVSEEILELLLRELTPRELARASLVCKDWKSAGALESVWLCIYCRSFFPKDAMLLAKLPFVGGATEARWRDLYRATETKHSNQRNKARFDRRQIEESGPEDATWLTHTARWRQQPTSICFQDKHPFTPHILTQVSGGEGGAIRELGYFEVEIFGGASVGLATQRHYLGGSSHVGWRMHSYGYHSDDGSKWRSDGSHGASNGLDGVAYAQPFGESGSVDIVGCGLDFEANELFFTLNGVMQGIAFRDVEWKKVTEDYEDGEVGSRLFASLLPPLDYLQLGLGLGNSGLGLGLYYLSVTLSLSMPSHTALEPSVDSMHHISSLSGCNPPRRRRQASL